MEEQNKIYFEVICLDTCTIFGEGIRRARLLKKSKNPRKEYKEIKGGKTLKTIKEKTRARFVTIITPYEFIKELSKKEGITFPEARSIYEEIRADFVIGEIIPKPAEIKLCHALLNKFLESDLEFSDGMQIHLASLRKMPFLTSEKDKYEDMKKFYEGVIQVKDILKQ